MWYFVQITDAKPRNFIKVGTSLLSEQNKNISRLGQPSLELDPPQLFLRLFSSFSTLHHRLARTLLSCFRYTNESIYLDEK